MPWRGMGMGVSKMSSRGAAVDPRWTGTTSGPGFVDPVSYGTNLSKMFMEWSGRPTSTGVLWAITGFNSDLFLNTTALRMNLRDSAGAFLVSNNSAGAYTLGNKLEIKFSFDLVARYAKTWINGVLAHNRTFAANTGVITTNQSFLIHTGRAGQVGGIWGINIPAGTFDSVRLWKDATEDGSLPPGAPYKTLIGPTGEINADPWRIPGTASATNPA